MFSLDLPTKKTNEKGANFPLQDFIIKLLVG